MRKHPVYILLIFHSLFFGLFSCHSQKNKPPDTTSFFYQRFRDSVIKANPGNQPDSSNIFDSKKFIPGSDSLQQMLIKMDTMWRRQAALLEHLDSLPKQLGKEPGFSTADLDAINHNIAEVEKYLLQKDTLPQTGCREKQCMVYAEIDKSRQMLYLHIMGELKDSFKVSTGKGKKYETPEMSRHPAGPVLVKYTSRKFPGGNYMGLGNMPYAVFVRGGYAIHGTTPGNYSRLGSRASHGCIRLHPDNAKVFNALVRVVGLEQTWISIQDSLAVNTK
jgi:hypothetical protein